MIDPISRRTLMIAGAAGMAATLPVAEAGAAAYDPRTSAEGQIKLTATLDGTPAFWIYSGVIYALRPEQHPLAILAASGCASHWSERRADGSYQLTGATLTFFRDLTTGAILDVFDNPMTGQRNQVKANLLAGGGSLIYPADGSSARAEGKFKAGVVAPKGYGEADPKQALGLVRWNTLGDSVFLETDRSWPVPVQPQLEAQTQSADRAAFFDAKVRRMPARFTATTIAPWMTWMEMGATPGNLVWHTSGEKGFSLDRLEPDYRARAGARMEKLATKP